MTSVYKGKLIFRSYNTCSHLFPNTIKLTGANAVILTIDVSKDNALASVADWLGEIRKLSSADTEIYFVATKVDLVDERKFTSEEAKAISEANDASYIEVSSKSGKNVDSLFFKIVNDMEVINYYTMSFTVVLSDVLVK
jgi:GTPase SAR1 family protein